MGAPIQINKSGLILVLICIGILFPLSLAATVEDTAIITMTNKDMIYLIDYGDSVSNVLLTEYSMKTNVGLNAVQSWNIYSSNDGSVWVLADSQVNISFVDGVRQNFSIPSPTENRYYEIRLKNGFYTIGNTITLTLTTDQNTAVPVPPVFTGGTNEITENSFFITMTNTRVLYTIDYGTDDANVTLLSYKVLSEVNLDPAQSWDIYGSNDETGWSLIDTETGASFTTGVFNTYTLTVLKPYQFYIIYLNGGFYNIGKTALFIFRTNINGDGNVTPNATPTPTPTPTPTGTATPYPTQVEGEQSSRIRAEIGETYIKWDWSYDNGTISIPVNIYVNDTNIPVEMGYTKTSYLVTGLQPGEKHNIAIYTTNGTQLIGRATATTIMQSEIIYIMLGLCFVIMIIIFAIKDMIKFTLISIFNIILSLFGATLASGHGMLPYVFIGIAILTSIILLIQGLPRLREKVDWL